MAIFCPAREELTWFLRQARAPRIRSMRQFAEEEIVLPSGRFAGLKFRVDRQPFSGLLLDAYADPRYNRFAVTGPTQTGKTVLCFTLPICYHLFEMAETVVCGIPDMDMSRDKWELDLLPIIERTRYRDLLPRRGGGSQGGRVTMIRFRNGAALRFMSSGGGDKSRAGFTSRVLVCTEVDGMAVAKSTSQEADPIKQLMGRLRAWTDEEKRIYLECTVTTADGRIWREYQEGTQSRIVCHCPHCAGWVTPEREHFQGWQNAADELEAREKAHFQCPQCRHPWTPADRLRANREAVLCHRGQEISPEGRVTGKPPPTRTLGFRWSAVNNFLVGEREIGYDCWKASRAEDEENAEKEQSQFVWCVPYVPPKLAATPLDAWGIAARLSKTPRGLCPEETEYLTIQIDLGKWLAHWMAVAWRADGSSFIVEYDRFDVPSASFAVEQAILLALRQFRDGRVAAGWAQEGQSTSRKPDQVLIDAGYQPDAVYTFLREEATDPAIWLPSIGCGTLPQQRRYTRPKATTHQVRMVGLEYHVVFVAEAGLHLVEVNADWWKAFLHRRLALPVDTAGAMLIHQAMPREHLTLAKHLTAEREIEEYVEGKGTVRRWEVLRRANHFLDCGYGACVAAHLAGLDFLPDTRSPIEADFHPVGQLTAPDGQPYLVNER